MFKGFGTKQQIFHGFPATTFGNNVERFGVSGCVLDLNANTNNISSNTDTASISYWQDEITGWRFQQATAASQPSYVASDTSFNNLPSLRFNSKGANVVNLECLDGGGPYMSRYNTIVAIVYQGLQAAAGTSHAATMLSENDISLSATKRFTYENTSNLSFSVGWASGNSGTGPTWMISEGYDFSPHIFVCGSDGIVLDGAVGTMTYDEDFAVNIYRIGGVNTTTQESDFTLARLLVWDGYNSVTTDKMIEISNLLNQTYAIY